MNKKLLFVSTILLTPFCLLAQTFNPVTPANGFNVFATGTGKFISSHADAGVAIGGDLTLAGDYAVFNNCTGSYPTATGGNGNYALVVGGKVNYTSGNITQVLNNGAIRVGNITGTTLYDQLNSSPCNLRATPGSYNSSPRIESNWMQSASSVTTGYGFSFSTAATALLQNSYKINNYSATLPNTFAYPTVPSGTGGTKTINLTANKINYINLSATDLNNMSPSVSSASYNFNIAPSATTIVIFNVQATGSYTWNQMNFASPSVGSLDNTKNAGTGKYILWNFASATTLTINNSNLLYGTVFAPNAMVIKSGNTGDIEGQIIANNVELAGGEMHWQVFAGNLPNSNTSTTPPNPTTGSGSPSTQPLPVEYMRLAASHSDAGNQLSYDMLTSSDLQIFTLQRSSDGADFSDAATLQIPANGAAVHATHVDQGLQEKVTYYRLRAVELSGVMVYSNIAMIRNDNTNGNTTAYPNPFTDRLNIKGGISGTYTWQLVNALGSVVSSGADDVVISGLNALPAGFYTLRLARGNDIQTLRLVKE